MQQRIRYRRGTAAEWTAANPLLLAGEPGYETDSGSFKVGNGVTRWNSLPYLLGPNAITGSIASAGDATITSPQNGDLLRYDNGKWRNTSETDVLNGGNF